MNSKIGIEETNNDTFLFNLQSNRRIKGMQKFEILDTKTPYTLYKPQYEHLITIGGYEQIKLYKKEYREKSRCNQYNKVFDYHGIKTAVCGRNSKNPFTMIKLVVFQMI